MFAVADMVMVLKLKRKCETVKEKLKGDRKEETRIKLSTEFPNWNGSKLGWKTHLGEINYTSVKNILYELLFVYGIWYHLGIPHIPSCIQVLLGLIHTETSAPTNSL